MRASQSSWSVKNSRSEKSSWYNRKRASGARHTKCMQHIGCSSKAASGNVVEFYSVCASRSSRSVKSSWYNRKRASGARHTKCVRHIGCSSKAASGNVVSFFQVHASQSSRSVKSSRSEKSSRYNGKRGSRACT